MTDLKNDFARLLADEPTGPDDLSSVVTAGRRALRRRTFVVGTAGTVGVAAVSAAIVVPTVVIGSSGSQNSSLTTAGSSPSPSSCRTFYYLARPGDRTSKADLVHAVKRLHRTTSGPIYQFRAGAHRIIGLSTCSKAERAQSTTTPAPTPTPTPTKPPAPRYHYTEQPRHIAHRLGAHLTDRLRNWGFTIVYTRPFAQETSQLEKGHPKYYGGNNDVQVKGGPADVGVQVTHAVTTQVAFSGSCSSPKCEQTTLPDGSVERTSRIHSGSGGAMVISVEVHHPDGLVVEAQQANYAFGPEATRSRSHQPLTLAQLKDLAADTAFSF
jgi:hypothetical protein